jgi:hypothetical protein
VGWLAPVVVILLLAAAGIFIGLSLSKPVPLAASAPPVAVTQQMKPVPPAPQPVVVATNTVSAESNAVVAAAPPRLPEPKLQGILFDAAQPCAIVSGNTVFAGDHVGRFRVAAISRDRVTLQSGTETNVLSLSRQ